MPDSCSGRRHVKITARIAFRALFMKKTYIDLNEYLEELDEGKHQTGRKPGKTYAHPHVPKPEPQEEPEEEEEQEEERPARKKKHPVRNFFRVILILLIAGCVLLGVEVNHLFSLTQPLNSTYSGNSASADVFSVMMVGVDTRGSDYEGRSDTMLMVTISRSTKKILITSVMRDIAAEIPGYGTAKLNAAYAYGGIDLLHETLENHLGLSFDRAVVVNFTTVRDAVDAIGGIDVTIDDEEMAAMNQIIWIMNQEVFAEPAYYDLLETSGEIHLNGKQALAYARIRYVGNADFERTERQRKVLDLMLSKLKHPSPTAIPKILSKAVPELKTNMTTGQLYLLSLEVPVKLIGYDMQKLRLPADGTYSDQTAPDGQMVLAVDFDANLQLYLKTIHDAPAPEPTASEEAIS